MLIFFAAAPIFAVDRICVTVSGDALCTGCDGWGDEFNLLFFIHVKDFFLKQGIRNL